MGMDVGSSSGGYSEKPNVVPMIDILLVLLIIFMMQVSLSRKIMNVNVPPVQEATQQEQQSSNQIVLELREDGSYAINNEVVPLSGLQARITEIFAPRPAKLMFIKTAGNRRYQEVVQAMDLARSGGVQVIGFTPPESQ